MSRCKTRKSWSGFLLIPVAAVLAGCGADTTTSLDGQQLAQQALAAALDAWKAGGAADELRQQKPGIIVGDLDWQAGRRLVDYRLAESGAFDGKHLRMPVTLIVQPSNGAHKRRVDTSYIVGIDPVITVIRESE